MNKEKLYWEETYRGFHQLVEYKAGSPNGNLVWAIISERRVSTEAKFQMMLPNEFKYDGPPEKTFTWGGPLVYVSSTYASWKRERALDKAKKWCEKVYAEYWDILSTHK